MGTMELPHPQNDMNPTDRLVMELLVSCGKYNIIFYVNFKIGSIIFVWRHNGHFRPIFTFYVYVSISKIFCIAVSTMRKKIFCLQTIGEKTPSGKESAGSCSIFSRAAKSHDDGGPTWSCFWVAVDLRTTIVSLLLLYLSEKG